MHSIRGLKWQVIPAVLAFMVNMVIGDPSKAQGSQVDTLKLKGPLNEWLCPHLSYFKDSSCQLEPRDVMHIFSRQNMPRGKNQLEFYGGYTRSNFWFLLTLKNDTTGLLPLFWSFNTSDLEFVLFDATDTSRIHLLDSASSHTPFSQREIPVRGITFRINLAPGQTRRLLVKVYPINIDYVNFPTNITTVEDYFLWEKDYACSLFFYLGVFVIALIANVCLGILLKVKLHLWHAAYIFALLLWNLNEFLYESLFLPEWLFHYYIRLPKVFFVLLAMLFALTVFQIFTHQARYHSTLFKCFRVYKITLIATETVLFCSIFCSRIQYPLFAIARTAAFYLGLLGICLLAVNIVAGMLKKERLIIIYAAISIFLILSILNNQLYEWFDLSLFAIYPNNLPVAVAVEISLLTIVFAYSRRLELEKFWRTNSELLTLKNDISLRIIATEEKERKRIAQDLHDELGSILAVLKIKAQSLGLHRDQMDSMTELLDKASDQVRNISHNLMPPEFETTPLETLIGGFFDKLNRNEVIAFNFITTGSPFEFTQSAALNIYRIVLELASNIIKHSRATHANIQFVFLGTSLRIMAEDDGLGFRPSSADWKGLKSIRTRVDFLQGQLNIDSGMSGTTIIITLPYN
jgi:signal transduction histidine kinase